MTVADYAPRDPAFETRVRESFARQTFMDHLGAELVALAPGRCAIAMDYRPELCQQHGFFHGGLVGTLADNAAGYAAFTLMAAEESILTVEYKLNLLAPADGERLTARAEVIRAGRALTVCRSDVFVTKGGAEKQCAAALVTLMALPGRADGPGPG